VVVLFGSLWESCLGLFVSSFVPLCFLSCFSLGLSGSRSVSSFLLGSLLTLCGSIWVSLGLVGSLGSGLPGSVWVSFWSFRVTLVGSLWGFVGSLGVTLVLCGSLCGSLGVLLGPFGLPVVAAGPLWVSVGLSGSLVCLGLFGPLFCSLGPLWASVCHFGSCWVLWVPCWVSLVFVVFLLGIFGTPWVSLVLCVSLWVPWLFVGPLCFFVVLCVVLGGLPGALLVPVWVSSGLWGSVWVCLGALLVCGGTLWVSLGVLFGSLCVLLRSPVFLVVFSLGLSGSRSVSSFLLGVSSGPLWAFLGLFGSCRVSGDGSPGVCLGLLLFLFWSLGVTLIGSLWGFAGSLGITLVLYGSLCGSLGVLWGPFGLPVVSVGLCGSPSGLFWVCLGPCSVLRVYCGSQCVALGQLGAVGSLLGLLWCLLCFC